MKKMACSKSMTWLLEYLLFHFLIGGRKEFLKDDYGRFPYGLPSDTSGDYVFVQHMIHLMKPETGKMAVVLPFGALFRGGLEQDIRKGIIEDGLIDSIISLPPKLPS